MEEVRGVRGEEVRGVRGDEVREVRGEEWRGLGPGDEVSGLGPGERRLSREAGERPCLLARKVARGLGRSMVISPLFGLSKSI